MAGVEFTEHDAATIAQLLVEVGIDVIEAGIISADDMRDAPVVRAALVAAGPTRVQTLVLARHRQQVERDLAVAQAIGCTAVMLSVPTSPTHARLKLGTESRQRIIALARSGIEIGKEMGFTVEYSAEDGARTDPAFLEEYVAIGERVGADRFRLAETVSTLRPETTAELIARLLHAAPTLPIQLHSHNVFGLAVANAITAFEAGARWISTTVNGLGERGGNTPLAELLCALWSFFGDRRYNLSSLTKLSEEVVRRSGLHPGLTAGPVGALSYAYEIAGQVQNPEAFEAVPAELVGNRRRVRVASRLRPALLKACLPRELAEAADLPGLTNQLLHQVQSGHGPLDHDSIVAAAKAFCSVHAGSVATAGE